MALKSGIFNSVSGDRKYKAEFFAEYFASFISNGVFPNPSTGLQIMANGNMTLTLKAGKAWINGYYLNNDSDYAIPLDVADGVLKRIDRIVLRLDFAARQITPLVLKGAFSSTPVAPTIKRDSDAYEIVLADILVNNGVLSIVQANVTDQRLNTSLCGIVHGTIDQVDTTTIFNQYQAWFNDLTANVEGEIEDWQMLQEDEFTTWFNSIKGQLTGDVAANLASQISTIQQNLKDSFAIGSNTSLVVTDPNSVVETGFYTITGSIVNCPPGSTAGALIHHKRDKSRPSQIYLDYLAFKMYHRHFTAAGWTAWVESESTSGALLKVEQNSYKTSKLNKDTNGIYTTVEYRRKADNTLVRRSVLSGGTSPLYTTRTVQFYNWNGTSVVRTDVFTLTYDSDGDLISEV